MGCWFDWGIIHRWRCYWGREELLVCIPNGTAFPYIGHYCWPVPIGTKWENRVPFGMRPLFCIHSPGNSSGLLKEWERLGLVCVTPYGLCIHRHIYTYIPHTHTHKAALCVIARLEHFKWTVERREEMRRKAAYLPAEAKQLVLLLPKWLCWGVGVDLCNGLEKSSQGSGSGSFLSICTIVTSLKHIYWRSKPFLTCYNDWRSHQTVIQVMFSPRKIENCGRFLSIRLGKLCRLIWDYFDKSPLLLPYLHHV
jgi:hypothetical protein